jgi:hypothetical protein
MELFLVSKSQILIAMGLSLLHAVFFAVFSFRPSVVIYPYHDLLCTFNLRSIVTSKCMYSVSCICHIGRLPSFMEVNKILLQNAITAFV